LSDFICDEFEKNHGVRPQYMIPPGIDPAEFQDPPPQRDIDLLAVGALIPLKQYEKLVGIVAEIKKVVPEIKVVIIGGGPEEQKIRARMRELGVRDNIILTRKIQHPKVLQLMQRSKLLIHPSSFEGFGVVCIEALAAGANVISFVKPMNREIEDWHVARTVPEMVQKIFSLLQNYRPSNALPSLFHIDTAAVTVMGLFKD
jgi:glycosyltransferase involved in cell wall biosynthesis